MTNEEFRYCVYNQYKCSGNGRGGFGFRSPKDCYEIINDRQKPQPTRSRYSQYKHFYRVKW